MSISSLDDLVNVPQATALLNKNRGGAPPFSGCALYTGVRGRDGYGVINVHAVGDSWRHWSQMGAHRLAFLLDRGYLPLWPRMVAHRCHNRPCCNPAHLKDAPAKENSADMVRAGRQARGERNGARCHPEKLARGERNPSAVLTEEQVLAIIARLAAGEKGTAIARDMGCAQSTVSAINTGAIWSHLPRPWKAS